MATAGESPAVRTETPGRRLHDELLFDLINRAPDAMAIMEERVSTGSLHLIYVNEAFCDLYLASKDEAIGAEVRAFMGTRALPEDVEKQWTRLQAGEPFSSTRCFSRSDGKTVWLEVNFRPVVMPDQPKRWIFVARDITLRKTAQDRAAQLAIAVEQGHDLVAINVVDDAAGVLRFAFVNEAFVRATGFSQADLKGKLFMDLLFDEENCVRFRRCREMLLAGARVREEMRLKLKDGQPGIFEVTMTPSRDPITQKYGSVVSILRDVTQERLLEERLQFDAEHDELTGLNNRRYLERMLGGTLASEPWSSAHHAVIFIDLDGLKAVNDRYGHAAGDEAILRAAKTFERCVCDRDVLVRWGGDEFVALLFNIGTAGAERVGASMLAELGKGSGGPLAGASIGIAPVEPGEPVAASIAQADGACYAAKAQGGNRAISATFPT